MRDTGAAMPKPAPPRCWENKRTVYLNQILDWCLKRHRVDTLLVTSWPFSGDRGVVFEEGVEETVKSIFQERLIKRLEARGWPGIELSKDRGRVYVIQFDATVMQRMVEVENELFAWSNNKPRCLPEDICVFKHGSPYPVLISVTHEKEAWVLSDKKSIPPGFKESDFRAEELFIWNGPYFCRV